MEERAEAVRQMLTEELSAPRKLGPFGTLNFRQREAMRRAPEDPAKLTEELHRMQKTRDRGRQVLAALFAALALLHIVLIQAGGEWKSFRLSAAFYLLLAAWTFWEGLQGRKILAFKTLTVLYDPTIKTP